MLPVRDWRATFLKAIYSKRRLNELRQTTGTTTSTFWLGYLDGSMVHYDRDVIRNMLGNFRKMVEGGQVPPCSTTSITDPHSAGPINYA